MKWFDSYLSDRTQCVVVSGKTSACFKLKFGVPQGSVLGPILFTLYTKPLSSLIESHGLKYHMYADDTQLYSSVLSSDFQSLVRTFEACITDVKNWMVINKLQLNSEKTELVLF